ncbi:NAD-binding domain protein, partial [Rhizoctonia solani AG-3 Rhs1AP]
MPATSTKVFLIGATGYVGGAILTELLRTSASFTITALVRKDSDIKVLEQLGVKTIKGSFSDMDKIEQASREANIVYNAADADDLDLTRAVIRGLKSQKERGILIQTSGTGLLSDNYNGELTPEGSKIWNVQSFKTCDLEIFEAHEREEIDAYIIAPSCIYGLGDGPVNKISQQVPRLIRAAVEFKQPVYVGKGTNLWNNVHITDLVQLYTLVLNLALSVRIGEAPRPEAFANFYFGSVGEHAWGDVAKKLGPILLKKGKVEKAEARSIKADEVQNFSALATNSRSVAERSRKLGWTTVARSLEDTLEEDIDAVLEQMM